MSNPRQFTNFDDYDNNGFGNGDDFWDEWEEKRRRKREREDESEGFEPFYELGVDETD